MKTLLLFLIPCIAFAGSMDAPYDAFGVGGVTLVGSVSEVRAEGVIVSELRHGDILVVNYKRGVFIGDNFVTRAKLTKATFPYRVGYRPIPVYDASNGR